MYNNLTTSSQVHFHSPPFFVPDCLHSLFLNCSAPLYYYQSTVRRFATLACSTIAIDLLSSLIKHCSNTYSHLNIHSTLLQYWGRSNTHQSRKLSGFAIWLRFGRKFFNLAFVLFIFLHIFIQHSFWAKGILIPHLHKVLPLAVIQNLHPNNLCRHSIGGK
jgi:hypothetical protein